MANGKTHRSVGALAGAGNALVRSYDLGVWPAIAETLGGGVGGWVGGALPDIIEPATSPRHRAGAHSWATVATILTWVDGRVDDAQRFCRGRAEDWENKIPGAVGVAGLVAVIAAMFWRFAAGFFAGVEGGYLSHLALDALTPAGLPLLA